MELIKQINHALGIPYITKIIKSIKDETKTTFYVTTDYRISHIALTHSEENEHWVLGDNNSIFCVNCNQKIVKE